jgi:glutaminyl-peptide cyclotransferase
MRKIIYSIVILALAACSTPSNETDEVIEVSDPKKLENLVPTPDFNADSAYYYIDKQVSFGPRVPNTAPHAACAIWLEEKLIEFGFQVIVQTGQVKAWNGELLNIKNIIGQFNPEATERIMLSAHWDTRPYADKDSVNQYKPIDGANDGASGVGVLLEIARQISMLDPGYGLILYFLMQRITARLKEKTIRI